MSENTGERKAEPPKIDDGYFEKMSRALFQPGLMWMMIEKKWANFRTAFAGFSIERLAKFDERNIGALMKVEGIVRSERKIRANVVNAKECPRVKNDFGFFRNYPNSFKRDHDQIALDLRARFRHLGESLARIFLWTVGMKLNPNREERMWHSRHLKSRS